MLDEARFAAVDGRRCGKHSPKLTGSGSLNRVSSAGLRSPRPIAQNVTRLARRGIPLREAPPFRTLHQRYPIEDLAELLAEGISTGHPTMPEWRFDPGQIGDLIAYLKTLE